MRNRTSSGDRRRAEAGRGQVRIRVNRFPSIRASEIDFFIRAEDRIRPYLDQAQWVAIDRLPNEMGWYNAGNKVHRMYLQMKAAAKASAQEDEKDDNCTPNSDACPTCLEAIKAKYGDEIPFSEAQP